jgi:hypothetical protein
VTNSTTGSTSCEITSATDTTSGRTKLKVSSDDHVFNIDHYFNNCVSELVSKDGEEEDQCDGTAATETPSPTLAPAKLDHNPGICEKVVWNLTQSLLDLRQESDSLRETNDILRDMVEKHPNTSKTLLLDGPMVNDDDLAVMIQAIVKDKLNLSFKVKNVNRKKNGTVSFQVGSVSEKVEVVKAAKRKLKHSSFTITY